MCCRINGIAIHIRHCVISSSDKNKLGFCNQASLPCPTRYTCTRVDYLNCMEHPRFGDEGIKFGGVPALMNTLTWALNRYDMGLPANRVDYWSLTVRANGPLIANRLTPWAPMHKSSLCMNYDAYYVCSP